MKQSLLPQPHNHLTENASEYLNQATEAEPVTGVLFSEHVDCHSCLQKFMDAVPMPMAIKGADLKYKMCNQQFADIINCTREEVIEKSACELFPEQLAHYTELLDQRVLDSGGLSVSEPNIVSDSKSGTRHFVMHKTALKDADGNNFGIIGTGVDITSRKKMEEAIKHLGQGVSAHIGEEFFSRLAKLLAETLDADHVVISRHDNKQSGVGQNLAIYSNGEFKEGFACELNDPLCWKIISQGDSCLAEGDVKHFCPECILSGISAEGFIGTALHDREGVSVGAITVISESRSFCREFSASILNLFAERASCEVQRLVAEEDLVSTRDFYLNMLSNIPAMTWRKDTEGICDYFNDTWLAFTGLTSEEALQMTHGQFVHPDDRLLFLQTCESAYSEQKPFQIEMRLLHHDKTYHWVINAGRPFYTSAGNFAGYVGSCIDVNERKANEEHLRQVQRMEALGKMAGGIAHEFNNVLAVIAGRAELLRMKHGQDKALINALDAILKASSRACDLTNSMLAYTQTQRSFPEVVNLNQIVTGLEVLLNNIIRKDLTLELELENESLPVYADVGQIEQILVNLTTNSRDALSSGGVLVVKTWKTTHLPEHLARQEKNPDGPYAVLAVTDNGCGMSPEVLERIYDPYFSTKEVGKGTGLGLSAVHGIVAQHQGFISCTSEAGSGTSFKIYLPINDDPAIKGVDL